MGLIGIGGGWRGWAGACIQSLFPATAVGPESLGQGQGQEGVFEENQDGRSSLVDVGRLKLMKVEMWNHRISRLFILT